MLYGLMSGIIPIDGANEIWPLSNNAEWWLKLTPSDAGGIARATELQGVIDNSDLLNGAVMITLDSGKYVIRGKAAGNWEKVGDYLDALLLIVQTYIPYSTYTFDADVSAPSTGTTNTGSGSGTTTPTGSTDTTTGKIFGLDMKLVVILGIGLLFFMSSGKGGK